MGSGNWSSVAHSAGLCQDVRVPQDFPHNEIEAVMPRRLFSHVWLCLVLFLSLGPLSSIDGVALAQATTTTVKMQSSSNYFVDAAIVVVLFGGALFAVCRSSRRN